MASVKLTVEITADGIGFGTVKADGKLVGWARQDSSGNIAINMTVESTIAPLLPVYDQSVPRSWVRAGSKAAANGYTGAYIRQDGAILQTGKSYSHATPPSIVKAIRNVEAPSAVTTRIKAIEAAPAPDRIDALEAKLNAVLDALTPKTRSARK